MENRLQTRFRFPLSGNLESVRESEFKISIPAGFKAYIRDFIRKGARTGKSVNKNGQDQFFFLKLQE